MKQKPKVLIRFPRPDILGLGCLRLKMDLAADRRLGGAWLYQTNPFAA
jgi:hypothetical protein